MARISFLSKENASADIQTMFTKMENSGTPILNLFKVMAHCPKVGRNFMRLGNAILFKGVVPPNLRELAILRVGNIYDATYEFTQHVPIALQNGVTQEQIEDLPNWQKSGKFNEGEQAILQYTDEVTKNIRVKNETFTALKKFLSEEAIVELTTAIGYYGTVSKIVEALQIELEK